MAFCNPVDGLVASSLLFPHRVRSINPLNLRGAFDENASNASRELVTGYWIQVAGFRSVSFEMQQTICYIQSMNFRRMTRNHLSHMLEGEMGERPLLETSPWDAPLVGTKAGQIPETETVQQDGDFQKSYDCSSGRISLIPFEYLALIKILSGA